MGANLAYVDASGQYFLFGHLYDIGAARPSPPSGRTRWPASTSGALPLADAIRDVAARFPALRFSDPDCPTAAGWKPS